MCSPVNGGGGIAPHRMHALEPSDAAMREPSHSVYRRRYDLAMTDLNQIVGPNLERRSAGRGTKRGTN
jgi:hypothetical protein